MKLLDLLKSLNNGTATDPDSKPEESGADHRRLLDELNTLLVLLDAPAGPTATDAIAEPASLLNIEAIFDGTGAVEPEYEKIDTTPNAEFHSSTTVNTQIAAGTHKQLVRSLLDELMPMLEKALGERLDELDNDTLEQWQQALTGAGDTADAESSLP